MNGCVESVNTEKIMNKLKKIIFLKIILFSENLRNLRNFDSQNAFTSGMLQSTGDAVILLDGDLQDPPEIIEVFVEKWLEGFDVVYGSRINRDTSKLMNYAYKTFYRLFNKLSYLEIPLDAGDFSLMDRKVVNEINNTKEKDRFIRGLRAWVGFKQIGVPYHRPEMEIQDCPL